MIEGVGKTLNKDAFQSALAVKGLSQSALAKEMGVTPAAVSNWVSGKDFPRPDKLLRLGVLLGLGFDALVQIPTEPGEPVAAYRKKGRHKLTAAHDADAVHLGRLLGKLVPHLQLDDLERPRTLRQPSTEYAYLQRVARAARARMGVAPDAPVGRGHLVDWYADLKAVLIPVLWGPRENDQNALHLYLPDSMTTWVYLNLDSKRHDFNFWMAHELAHVYAPGLRGGEGERFADGFAQALLFPEDRAAAAYNTLAACRGAGQRINAVKRMAAECCVSPVTVGLAVSDYSDHHGRPRLAGLEKIHAAAANFAKDQPTVSEELFGDLPPPPRQYMKMSATVFRTPFFAALRTHVRQTEDAAGLISTLLQIPLLDARSLVEALR